jgi:hypothetical protein
MAYPWQSLEIRAPLAQRNKKDISTDIRTKNGEKVPPAQLANPQDLNVRSTVDAEPRIVSQKVPNRHAQDNQHCQPEERAYCEDNAAGSAPRHHTAPDGNSAPRTKKTISFFAGLVIFVTVWKSAGLIAGWLGFVEPWSARFRRGNRPIKLVRHLILIDRR